jgi:glutamine amidotransferase
MICLVDSGICNLASVVRAFERVGAPVRTASRPEDFGSAAAVVLPGVGAFGDGMESLRTKRLVEPLRRAAADGTPLLGICLGMQLLLEESEEHGRHAGLGLLPGRVVRLCADRPGFRVPNIGWCDAAPVRDGVLFPAGMKAVPFYFVHSFRADIPADHVAATIEFSGHPVTAALEHGNVFGVQFHPEKSQDAGLDLLARWVEYLRHAGRLDVKGATAA